MLPYFTTWQFALAGLLAAAGPVLIHLLTRRRQRRLEWGAMELLLRVVRERRRNVRLRDMLVLALRCLAVALFGLALAQPFLAQRRGGPPAHRPAELTVMVDNSLSMGYETLAGSNLEIAVRQARQIMEQMPPGSRFRVVPLCGTTARGSQRETPILEEALAALEAIQLVDRPLTMSQVVEAVQETESSGGLSRRAILFTDMQASSWNAAAALASLDSVKVVVVAQPDRPNSWVASVQLQDQVAFSDSTATIQVRLGHRGGARETQLTLEVDGQPAATRAVHLAAGETERLVAIPYHFVAANDEAKTASARWQTLTAAITPDELPADDTRHALVAVVPTDAIQFVDQFGSNEDRASRRIGETLPLRRLLAASQPRGSAALSFPHLRLEQLSRELLSRARVVVVAGVQQPAPAVPMLREFVSQGGRLLILAGGEFDPQAWNAAAWLGGAGILPAPLDPALLGRPVQELVDLSQSFLLAPTPSRHPFFELGSGIERLDDLLAEPIFFQAAALRLAEANPIVPSGNARPRWLGWQPPLEPPLPREGNAPQVLLAFNDSQATPYLVQQRIGAGSVVFTASGLLPQWNTLSQTNAILLFHAILRELVRSTLEPRDYSPANELLIPLAGTTRTTNALLSRPQQTRAQELLEIGFIGESRRGAMVERPFERGLYEIQLAAQEPAGRRELPAYRFTVNGSERESDLTSLTPSERDRIFAPLGGVELLTDVQANDVVGRGVLLWQPLLIAVIALLIAEMFVLAERRESPTGAADAART